MAKVIIDQRVHELAMLPRLWDAIKSGEKTFIVRSNDRGFQRGDHLVLQRLDPDTLTDAGGPRLQLVNGVPLSLRYVIGYVMTGAKAGVAEGWAVMSLLAPKMVRESRLTEEGRNRIAAAARKRWERVRELGERAERVGR